MHTLIWVFIRHTRNFIGLGHHWHIYWSQKCQSKWCRDPGRTYMTGRTEQNVDRLHACLHSPLAKHWLLNSAVLLIPVLYYWLTILLRLWVLHEFMFCNLSSVKKYRFLKSFIVIANIWLGSLFLWIINLNEPRQANLCLRAFRHYKF